MDHFYKQGRDYSLATNCPDTQFGILLSKLASKFIACQRDYISCFKEEDTAQDLGYFYNERTNIGFLAAAAWRQKNWVALEEFACDKKHRVEKGKLSKGRADLYIGVRASNNDITSISIEAKQQYVSNAKSLRAALDCRRPESIISKAILDARHSVDADYRCAAVFICESLRNDRHYDKHDQEISDAFYGSCKSFLKPWVAFAFFPKEEYPWERDRKGFERRYPAVGVVILQI